MPSRIPFLAGKFTGIQYTNAYFLVSFQFIRTSFPQVFLCNWHLLNKWAFDPRNICFPFDKNRLCYSVVQQRPESALVDDHALELYIHIFLHGELFLFIIPQISLHKAAPEIATLCTFPKLEQNYCLQLHRVFHKPASVFVNTHFSVCSEFQRNRASTVSVSCVTKSRAPL